MKTFTEKEKNKVKDYVTQKSRQTIGYDEAENKKSFNVGVSVGMMLTLEKMEERLNCSYQLHYYDKIMLEERNKDLQTLSSIIKKYSAE